MSLTGYQKQVVELSLQNMPPAEIAEKLNRSRQSIYSTQDRLKKSGHLAKDGNRFVPGPELAQGEQGTVFVPPTDSGALQNIQAQAQNLIGQLDREIEKRRQEIALLESQRKTLQNLVETSSELFA